MATTSLKKSLINLSQYKTVKSWSICHLRDYEETSLWHLLRRIYDSGYIRHMIEQFIRSCWPLPTATTPLHTADFCSTLLHLDYFTRMLASFILYNYVDAFGQLKLSSTGFVSVWFNIRSAAAGCTGSTASGLLVCLWLCWYTRGRPSDLCGLPGRRGTWRNRCRYVICRKAFSWSTRHFASSTSLFSSPVPALEISPVSCFACRYAMTSSGRLFSLHFLTDGAEVGDCNGVADRFSACWGMLVEGGDAAVIACERITSATSRSCEAAKPFVFFLGSSSTSRWMSTISCSSCSFSACCSSVPDHAPMTIKPTSDDRQSWPAIKRSNSYRSYCRRQTAISTAAERRCVDRNIYGLKRNQAYTSYGESLDCLQ